MSEVVNAEQMIFIKHIAQQKIITVTGISKKNKEHLQKLIQAQPLD